MKKITILQYIAIALIIMASFAGGYSFALYQNKLLQLPLSRFVLQVVQKEYVDPYNDEMLARGIVYGTGDPFSSYLTKEEYQSFETQLSEKYVGIGVLISDQEGRMVIIKVFSDSPAEKGGIKPHMEIIKVNGEIVSMQGLEKVARLIRGPKDTEVNITVKDQEEEKEISLIRDFVAIETVEGLMLENQIAYLRIISFNFGTGKRFQQILDELILQNPRGIILDLRDNSGGVLDETIQVAERFLPSNAVILQSRDKSQKLKDMRIGNSIPVNRPVVVLVNRNSASAAEVLTGALQDHDAATIMGEQTYGKASIQRVFPVPFMGSAVKLTVQRYLTPSGFDISRQGLKPDVIISDESRFLPEGQDLIMLEAIKYFQN